MRNAAEKITSTREKMVVQGYRVVREADISPGQELVLVDIDVFTLSGNGLHPSHAPGCTIVKLDEEPIRQSDSGDNSKTVFYHCIKPAWSGQCFVPQSTLLLDSYVPRTTYENDTRYFIKN